MYTYMALDLELFPVLPVDLDILLYQNHQLPQPKPGLQIICPTIIIQRILEIYSHTEE